MGTVGARRQPHHVNVPEAWPSSQTRGQATNRAQAETGSERLRKRLLKYGSQHGLPNLSTLQCIAELRLLDRILDEDLILADKLQAELLLKPIEPAICSELRGLMRQYGLDADELGRLAKVAAR